VPTSVRLGIAADRQMATASALIRSRSCDVIPPSRKYAITAAISLPRRNRSSITRFASADSEPRTRKVSLSSAASSWRGP
jgi:hypothetical protein